MTVAERSEALRTAVRAMTDRLMRMTGAFPGTHHVEPTLDELAELDRRDDVEQPTTEPEEQLPDQQHPLAPRLEHGHPKL